VARGLDVGGAIWATGSYDVAINQVLWGAGNSAPIGDFRGWKNHDGYKRSFERVWRDLKLRIGPDE
jgi:hypothetical protein